MCVREKGVGFWEREKRRDESEEDWMSLEMAAESSEGEEDGKLSGGNQLLMVDDELTELGKKAAWSVSSCKPGNGVSSLRDDNLDTYWQFVTYIITLSLSLSLSHFQHFLSFSYSDA